MSRRIKVGIILLAMLLLYSGTVFALSATSNKVDIIDGDKKISTNTFCETVGELLESKGIELEPDTILNVSLDDEITDKMCIEIKRAVMVFVTIDDTQRLVRTTKETVQEVLDEAVGHLDGGYKVLSAKLSDQIYPLMDIKLTTEYSLTVEIKSEVPFPKETKETDALLKGKTRVIQQGINGEKSVKKEVFYKGNDRISETILAENTIIEATPEITEIGTYVEPPKNLVPLSATTVSKVKYNKPEMTYSRVITMNASAYTTDNGDSGPITATGERCRVGLVAVDPKVIPLGTMLYIENYGVARAADTGGAIKGNKIDLYFNTYSEVYNFGRRNIKVYVLE